MCDVDTDCIPAGMRKLCSRRLWLFYHSFRITGLIFLAAQSTTLFAKFAPTAGSSQTLTTTSLAGPAALGVTTSRLARPGGDLKQFGSRWRPRTVIQYHSGGCLLSRRVLFSVAWWGDVCVVPCCVGFPGLVMAPFSPGGAKCFCIWKSCPQALGKSRWRHMVSCVVFWRWWTLVSDFDAVLPARFRWEPLFPSFWKKPDRPQG